MVVQRLWNFVNRHRKKFIATGIIIGGVYYTFKVYLPKVQQRILEGLLKELQEGASSSDSQAQRQEALARFQKHQRVSDDYARKGLPAFKDRHDGCFKLAAAQAKVQAAKDKESKLTALKDLQVECLALVASAVYSLHVILLLHRVQFNLAGREVAVLPPESRSGAESSKANGEEASSSMQELINSTEYFLEKGPTMMSAAARKAVEAVTAVGPLLPDSAVNSESLSSFFKQVFDKMGQEIWDNSKGSTLLPPEGAANGQREQVKELLDEARDYLESPQVLHVVRSTISSSADRLPEQLAAFGGKASVLKEDGSVLLAVLFGSCISLAKSLLAEAESDGSEGPAEVTIRSFADQNVVTEFCEGLYFQEPSTKK